MDKSFSKAKKGVLIIDDMYDDYNHISEFFKDSGWEVFPDKDDYRLNWKRIYLESEPLELSEFIREYLKKNYCEISFIILDVWLIQSEMSDQTGIDKVLPMIRNFKADDEEFKEWGARVPIIVLTQIPSREIARTSLTSHEYVDAFFRKDRFVDEPNLLVFTAESLLSTFRLRIQEGLDGIIADKIDAVRDYLERSNKAVISRINDVEIILKGQFASIRLFLNALFVQMTDEDKGKITQEFSMELKQSLGDEQFKKIEKSLQKLSLKEDFKNCIKKGIKADFVEFLLRVFEELSTTGALTGLPFAKFIGYGLSTVLKIMSK